MRIGIAFVLLTVILSFGSAFGGEIIYLDNKYIQEHRGKLGQWRKYESYKKLVSWLKETGVKIKDFQKINGKYSRGSQIFIPYSNRYVSELRTKGYGREQIICDSGQDYVWPIRVVNRITSSFGMRWGVFHHGIDIPAGKGTPILAAMDGRVVNAKYQGGHGKSIVMEHRNNLFTRYSHTSTMLVKKGQFVRKGQIIGFVGCTGDSTGNHLHFEVRYKNIALNPMDFLPKKNNIKVAKTIK